jgi:hypothetical protein
MSGESRILFGQGVYYKAPRSQRVRLRAAFHARLPRREAIGLYLPDVRGRKLSRRRFVRA